MRQYGMSGMVEWLLSELLSCLYVMSDWSFAGQNSLEASGQILHEGAGPVFSGLDALLGLDALFVFAFILLIMFAAWAVFGGVQGISRLRRPESSSGNSSNDQEKKILELEELVAGYQEKIKDQEQLRVDETRRANNYRHEYFSFRESTEDEISELKEKLAESEEKIRELRELNGNLKDQLKHQSREIQSYTVLIEKLWVKLWVELEIFRQKLEQLRVHIGRDHLFTLDEETAFEDVAEERLSELLEKGWDEFYSVAREFNRFEGQPDVNELPTPSTPESTGPESTGPESTGPEKFAEISAKLTRANMRVQELEVLTDSQDATIEDLDDLTDKMYVEIEILNQKIAHIEESSGRGEYIWGKLEREFGEIAEQRLAALSEDVNKDKIEVIKEQLFSGEREFQPTSTTPTPATTPAATTDTADEKDALILRYASQIDGQVEEIKKLSAAISEYESLKVYREAEISRLHGVVDKQTNVITYHSKLAQEWRDLWTKTNEELQALKQSQNSNAQNSNIPITLLDTLADKEEMIESLRKELAECKGAYTILPESHFVPDPVETAKREEVIRVQSERLLENAQMIEELRGIVDRLEDELEDWKRKCETLSEVNASLNQHRICDAYVSEWTVGKTESLERQIQADKNSIRKLANANIPLFEKMIESAVEDHNRQVQIEKRTQEVEAK